MVNELNNLSCSSSVVFVPNDMASLLPPPTPAAGAMPRAHHHAMMHAFQFGPMIHFISSQ